MFLTRCVENVFPMIISGQDLIEMIHPEAEETIIVEDFVQDYILSRLGSLVASAIDWRNFTIRFVGLNGQRIRQACHRGAW